MKTDDYYTEQLPLGKEIETWIGLLIDHARFMRNGFDTPEERLFAEADNFSEEFAELSNRGFIDINRDLEFLHELQEEVHSFINFKNRVARRIENCQTLSILPAALINHIMREAIFFSGILARIKDEPRPNWRDLGLPDNRVASTAPQALIPGLKRELENISWEELLFWLTINYEHANVLSLYFRPQQGNLRQETLQWGSRINRLYRNTLNAFESSMGSPERFIEPARRLISAWTNFLRNLYRQLSNCTIPGEQMNIWPEVIDHMIREAVYFLQVLAILYRLYNI
jgi:hypothetical protein